ncbi:MAG: hypothetical protein HUJ77_12985 [Clostridium sp.]|uniref:hypothetical protein n=1 Tax=Clostridium sp. TaxID=1506 RepID=UPI0025C28A0C|nr:hypothetical protein [Clostridium sp.]MCF0149297.1 hypothetical protein [Clostridium sp.]
MNCIEIKDIFSTTVLYEGFFGYNDVFKFSEESINKLDKIAYKYKDYSETITDNKEGRDLENDNISYSKEFTYRFTNFISIDKLIYPFVINDTISYEIIDLSGDKERLILSSEDVNINNESLEIRLNNIKVNNIKLRINSQKNIWPNTSEFKIIKSIC